MQVLYGVAAFANLSSALLDQFGSQFIAAQACLGCPRSKGLLAQARHADTDILTATGLSKSKPDSYADNREAGGLLSHLEVGATAAPRRHRHADLRQNLGWLDRRRHGTKKKLLGGHL